MHRRRADIGSDASADLRSCILDACAETQRVAADAHAAGRTSLVDHERQGHAKRGRLARLPGSAPVALAKRTERALDGAADLRVRQRTVDADARDRRHGIERPR